MSAATLVGNCAPCPPDDCNTPGLLTPAFAASSAMSLRSGPTNPFAMLATNPCSQPPAPACAANIGAPVQPSYPSTAGKHPNAGAYQPAPPVSSAPAPSAAKPSAGYTSAVSAKKSEREELKRRDVDMKKHLEDSGVLTTTKEFTVTYRLSPMALQQTPSLATKRPGDNATAMFSIKDPLTDKMESVERGMILGARLMDVHNGFDFPIAFTIGGGMENLGANITETGEAVHFVAMPNKTTTGMNKTLWEHKNRVQLQLLGKYSAIPESEIMRGVRFVTEDNDFRVQIGTLMESLMMSNPQIVGCAINQVPQKNGCYLVDKEVVETLAGAAQNVYRKMPQMPMTEATTTRIMRGDGNQWVSIGDGIFNSQELNQHNSTEPRIFSFTYELTYSKAQ